MADADAIVVQCPGCEARFQLAKDRVPVKGARVRCSRCQHRFFVSREGEVSDAPSRPRVSRETPPSTPSIPVPADDRPSAERAKARAPKAEDLGSDDCDPARSPWSMRAGPDPKEDTDLDNPEFLFDARANAEAAAAAGAHDEVETRESSSAPGQAAGALAEELHVRGDEGDGAFELGFGEASSGATDLGEPAAEVTESPSSAGDAADGAIPDIRAHRDELAAQRALAALDAAGFDDATEDSAAPEAPGSGTPRGAERSGGFDSFSTGSEAGAGQEQEVGPTGSAGSDENPFELGSTTPSAAESTVQVVTPAPEDSFADLADDVADIVDGLPSDSRAASSVGESRAASVSSESGARASGERGRVARGAGERAGRSGFAGANVEQGQDSGRLGQLAAVIAGLLLAVGGVRLAYLNSVRAPEFEPTATSELASVPDLRVRVLRDLRGRPVLIATGEYQGQAALSELRAVLLDPRGNVVAEPVPLAPGNVPDRLSDADVSQLLRGRLPLERRRVAGERGSGAAFAVVVPNLPAEARRLALIRGQ